MKQMFLHKRNSTVNGTLVIEIEDDDLDSIRICSTGEEFFVKIGISVCHPKDNFNKKIGRDVALGRLASTFITCIFNNGAESLFLIKNTNSMLKFRGSHLIDAKQANFHI
jgi:hypothetical protein